MSVGSSRAAPGPAAALRCSMTSGAIGVATRVRLITATSLMALAGLGLRHAPVQRPIAAPQTSLYLPGLLTLVHVGTPIDHCLSRMREEVFLHLQTAPYQAHEPHPAAQSPGTRNAPATTEKAIG